MTTVLAIIVAIVIAVGAMLVLLGIGLLTGCAANSCVECHATPPPIKRIGNNLYIYEDGKWIVICEDCPDK